MENSEWEGCEHLARQLIEGMFTPKEAELITSIPLSRCEAETQSEQMAHEKILCRTLWSLQVPNNLVSSYTVEGMQEFVAN